MGADHQARFLSQVSSPASHLFSGLGASLKSLSLGHQLDSPWESHSSSLFFTPHPRSKLNHLPKCVYRTLQPTKLFFFTLSIYFHQTHHYPRFLHHEDGKMRTRGTQPGFPAGALGDPLPRPHPGTAVLSTDPGANSPALHPTSPATSSVA